MTAPLPGLEGVSDLVFTYSWAETWDDACVREMCMSGDRLLGTMMQHPAVGRLLVANPYRSWPIRWARRTLGQARHEFPAREGRALMAPMRVRRAHPTSVPAVRDLYAAYDRRLRRAAARLGMARPAILTINPFVAAFAPLLWAGPVTYYALDDWTAHPRNRRLWPAIDASYTAIRESGRRVCAVSQPLLDRLAPIGLASVVPNGVEPDEWRAPWSVPEWFTSLPTPRLLYVGTIDERLDVDSLAATAARYADGSVVLVGLVTNEDAITQLRQIANVHIRPPVGRREVAGMVHEADVCILPHRRTGLTETMSPIKLYEYLAGGRPVVASDLPPIRDVDPRVVLVGPGDSFPDGVSHALSSEPASESYRLACVSRHSWAGRHQVILQLALASTTTGLSHFDVRGAAPG